MAATASTRALELTEFEQLGQICPACFGPGVGSLPNGEPDIIVCMDCNFQQRRHLSASVERTIPSTPSLFIPPDQLESMRLSMADGLAKEPGGAHWSNTVVRALSSWFKAPNQYPC